MNSSRGFNQQPPPVPDQPLLQRSWHNPEFPANLINPDNAVMYFCHTANPFYDPTSDNQQLIMTGMPMDNLVQMIGIQFSLVHCCGPLYVIGKHKRISDSNVQPLCYYYIMEGIVYQCPDFFTLIESRLTQTANPLREALLQAGKYAKFDVNKGYSWQFDVEPAKSSKTEKEESEKKAKKSFQDPTKVRSTQYQVNRVEKLLGLMFKSFPPNAIVPPSNASVTSEVPMSNPGSVMTNR
uniref:Mediator of RNA polymerase II transcription subunit 6 n=1 Tax=Panagrellus redivivus TaxID=6233 RepID=A0A7E4VLU2_PANRE